MDEETHHQDVLNAIEKAVKATVSESKAKSKTWYEAKRDVLRPEMVLNRQKRLQWLCDTSNTSAYEEYKRQRNRLNSLIQTAKSD